MSNLQSAESLAVAKVIKDAALKAARSDMQPGVYDVDFTVKIDGTITVGHDYQAEVPNKAKPWNLVVALMAEIERLQAATGKVGIDLDKILAAAETMDPTLVEKAEEAANEAAAKLKAATLSPCKGKVTTKLTVTKV